MYINVTLSSMFEGSMFCAEPASLSGSASSQQEPLQKTGLHHNYISCLAGINITVPLVSSNVGAYLNVCSLIRTPLHSAGYEYTKIQCAHCTCCATHVISSVCDITVHTNSGKSTCVNIVGRCRGGVPVR